MLFRSKVAINPFYVIAVFTPNDGPAKGKTVISLVNGTIPVEENELDVVAIIDGEKSA